MTERKYTDEEIVKALECFYVGVGCKGCPFIDQGCFDCGNIPTEFSESVLALINRQKAEIENLQEVNADLNESLRLAAEANKDMKIELDAMRGAANSLKMHYDELYYKYQIATYEGFSDLIVKLREKYAPDIIERQKAEIESLENSVRLQAEMLYEAKTEAIKEFAERLKANMCHGYIFLEIEEDLFRRDVDNLVAEMTEGE